MKTPHTPKTAQIWVDADACPYVIRDILFRAAARTCTAVTLEELRGAGIAIGGPPALHARDRQAFSAQLARWLAAQPRPPL
ncbi:hypothetical protein [Xanthomonas vasicola]|uniref:YaiI/YqxD family protein n=1 Tax=Xanthomonas vasicola TaxID=56459 RepID=A0ABD7SDE2_XANVA|nr:hypothetical protein [Xanthomonas vasicola]AZR23129.1 hypothetical protein NX81_013350 [Xanthomonas vasicola]KGR43111.1 hypothetical protein NX05_12050 [Xanthomonas vasicola]KGR60020.1 hypothetical protein NX79_12645 [Xanthomonas vasicola]MDO6983473.1 hypothetical protein [Xanthomonas vasicola]PPV03301.1 hypothetical protein XvhCFBP2543_07080 [Xanthomonas vasicola]